MVGPDFQVENGVRIMTAGTGAIDETGMASIAGAADLTGMIEAAAAA